MRILALICCIVFCAFPARAEFGNPPSWAGDAIKSFFEKYRPADADAVIVGECHWLDKNPDDQPGLNCLVDVGDVRIYTVGSDNPPGTRLVHMVSPRDLLKKDFKLMLTIVTAFYDPDFPRDAAGTAKIDAFLNNIDKQPRDVGPLSSAARMQGGRATFLGQAFYFKEIQMPFVSVKITPR